jgi:hypothetical protein
MKWQTTPVRGLLPNAWYLGSLLMLTVATLLVPPISLVFSQEVIPPPNAPTATEWDVGRGELTLDYHGERILRVSVTAKNVDGHRVAVHMDSTVNAADERVQQTFVFKPAESGDGIRVALSGTVTGSGEAFPAETDSEAQQRFPCVRNSVGLSRNLRNNAVYDRRWDWVLIGPTDGSTRIKPETDEGDKRTFVIQCTGEHLQIVFRPRFYQRHHGYRYFEPWTYKIWKGSLTGYCTWWAYRHSFTQETLDAMLALFVEEHLPDFGYDYMQFDDAYQQGNGSCPENWLNWNSKFPGGWAYAVQAIRDAGMKPGIWVHRIHRPSDPHVKDLAQEHPDWFVRKSDGSLVMHHGFYMLDTTNEEAIENMVRKRLL